MAAWALREFWIQGREEGGFTAAEAAEAMVKGLVVEGDYLSWFDVDALRGKGGCRFTPDPLLALRFESQEAALEAWRKQSTVRPLREDGRPNRPLTAISMTPVRLT